MSLAGIEPVDRESTAGIIARQLRQAIMNGALPPGTQLGEAELAAQFQVSRGPLREAMQRLLQEGLLRSERHRGLFVIDLEPGDVYDIYSTRAAIERAAAIRVMRGDDREGAAEALDEAVRLMSEAAAADDPAALSDADLQFHETLVAASGSRRLARMAGTLLIETQMCLSALQRTYQRVDDRVTEHSRIVDAIRAGAEDSVLSLLEAHMEDAVQRLAPGTSLRSGAAPGVPTDGIDLPSTVHGSHNGHSSGNGPNSGDGPNSGNGHGPGNDVTPKRKVSRRAGRSRRA